MWRYPETMPEIRSTSLLPRARIRPFARLWDLIKRRPRRYLPNCPHMLPKVNIQYANIFTGNGRVGRLPKPEQERLQSLRGTQEIVQNSLPGVQISHLFPASKLAPSGSPLRSATCGERLAVSMRKSRLMVLMGCVLLLGFIVVSGRLLEINQPEKADVILVLAGETSRRPERALQLLDQGFAQHMILDVPVNGQIYQWTQLDLAQQYVNGLAEAKSVSICPIWGLSTRDEARDTVACLKHAGGSSVLLVTSDFHTRRALNIFRHELRGYTFHVAAAFDEDEFGTHWWKQREWAKTAVSEWTKFFWWEAVDRWRASVSPSNN